MLEDARGKCRSLVKGGFGSIFSFPMREMTEEKLEELGLKKPQGKLLNAMLGENGKFELSSQSNFSNYHNSSSRRLDKNPESWVRSGSSHEPQIQVIEWHMMEKSKFYPLSMMSSFSIRCLLYPFTVVKTCLQVQQKNNVYTSMLDAYKKIYRSEGIKGLYKGFWISAFQIVSGVCYVSTYEGVRHFLLTNDIKEPLIRAVVAGCCASIVGQTFIVPFDVISQHIMVLGQASDTSKNGLKLNPLNINYINRSKSDVTRQIISNIYKRDGFKGFYRGYCASLGTYVPNSTLWWGFYQFYTEKIINLLPKNSSHLMVQCISATLGGFTTTIITNPLDVCRARIQVQRIGSFSKTFEILWKEEGMRIFTKGLSARITQSILFSFAIILGYETIKRFSVKEDYRENVRW